MCIRDRHIAFPHDPFRLAVAGHIVRTSEHAIFAANTLIVQVLDDSGDRILFVRSHRAPMHASGFNTVMASGGHVLHDRIEIIAAGQQTNVPPDLTFLQAVETMTRGDARLTTGARIKVDLKRILLSILQAVQRNQVTILRFVGRSRDRQMALRKLLHGSQLLLGFK